MSALQQAARLRAIARSLILEAEQLEAQSAPPPPRRNYMAELQKLKQANKREKR